MTRLIAGAGGGGKGGASNAARTPVEQRDSLRSNSFARVLDAVSEGEIEGLVDGLRSVYLDGTPVQNPDGSYNFQNVVLETRTGTQAQGYIPGFAAVENTVQVGTQVTFAAPVVRTITNPNINAVSVMIGIPQLTEQNTSNGDLLGSQVLVYIDVQTAGGGWVLAASDLFTGKTTTRYQRSFRIPLSGSGPWDVRVRRMTADSTSVALQNATWFDAYTEIIDAKLRYPNTALAGLRVDASQFQNIPTRAYDMKLLRVRVPSNYNPVTRVYTGSWDGTFVVAWTDNPAWCFYDLVTNDRYGLGGLVSEAQVDKWALYAIGRYCDELVPDGFGGMEPRFTCNFYLQSRAEAYKVLQDFASIFRGMVYWSTGAVTAVQDAPADPVALFTAANVVDGAFRYEGSGLKARHTVALVTWNDPADLYKQKVEYVEDVAGIERYGVQQTEVVAIGCTSRGQAHRVGRWLLYSERYETETVQFSVGLDGAVVRPGHIVKVADPARAAARLGGRVVSATATAVTLDVAPDLGALSWTLYCLTPAGGVESRAVTGAVGRVLSVGVAFSAAPLAGSVWMLSTATVEAQTFRVVSIGEADEGSQFTITALKHEPLKFAAVENGLVLQTRDITNLSALPPAPTGGRVTEYLYATLTDVKVSATIAWSQVAEANQYEVQYRVGAKNPVTVTVPTAELEIRDADTGTYTVRVRSLSAIGMRSAPYEFLVSVLGKAAPPAAVSGLQMTAQGDTGLLQWDLHPDLDVRIGGQILVRYTSDLTGARWNTAMPVANFPGAASSGPVPLRAGTYLVRAMDSSDVLSDGATSVVTDAANIVQFNAVATSTQEPGFAGAKAGLAVVGGRLQLEQASMWDDIADLDAYTTLSDGGLVESGTYDFDAFVDTGAVYTSRVSAAFSVVSFDVANMVDQWVSVDALASIDESAGAVVLLDDLTDFDAVVNFDQQQIEDGSAVQLLIATTNDDPGGVPAWSDWRTFYVGDYTARAFRFRAVLSRGENADRQVSMSSLGVVVDVPDRVESADNVAVPAGGLAVVFPAAFFATPAIAITAENLATGDYAAITAKSATGFTIQFRNSAGSGVARTMDWIAKGYGYRA